MLNDQENFIRLTLEHALPLMQDQYGNYVVQHVLQKEPQRALLALTACALPHLIPLSTQKYSSNVLEKCLQLADEATRGQWLTALATPEAVARLHRDAFGNYVLQAALQAATPVQRQPVLAILTPLLQRRPVHYSDTTCRITTVNPSAMAHNSHSAAVCLI